MSRAASEPQFDDEEVREQFDDLCSASDIASQSSGGSYESSPLSSPFPVNRGRGSSILSKLSSGRHTKSSSVTVSIQHLISTCSILGTFVKCLIFIGLVPLACWVYLQINTHTYSCASDTAFVNMTNSWVCFKHCGHASNLTCPHEGEVGIDVPLANSKLMLASSIFSLLGSGSIMTTLLFSNRLAASFNLKLVMWLAAADFLYAFQLALTSSLSLVSYKRAQTDQTWECYGLAWMYEFFGLACISWNFMIRYMFS